MFQDTPQGLRSTSGNFTKLDILNNDTNYVELNKMMKSKQLLRT